MNIILGPVDDYKLANGGSEIYTNRQFCCPFLEKGKKYYIGV